MQQYNIVMEQPESTVIAEYVAEWGDRPTAYQSEAELEEALLAQLQQQGYDYLPIKSEEDLIANLRRQRMETLLQRQHRQRKRTHRRENPQDSGRFGSGTQAG